MCENLRIEAFGSRVYPILRMFCAAVGDRGETEPLSCAQSNRFRLKETPAACETWLHQRWQARTGSHAPHFLAIKSLNRTQLLFYLGTHDPRVPDRSPASVAMYACYRYWIADFSVGDSER
jgi:hypothetical protein